MSHHVLRIICVRVPTSTATASLALTSLGGRGSSGCLATKLQASDHRGYSQLDFDLHTDAKDGEAKGRTDSSSCVVWRETNSTEVNVSALTHAVDVHGEGHVFNLFHQTIDTSLHLLAEELGSLQPAVGSQQESIGIGRGVDVKTDKTKTEKTR